jgi:hypothetical protein
VISNSAGQRVALEIDGPFHFNTHLPLPPNARTPHKLRTGTSNPNVEELNGATHFRNWQLSRHGYAVVSVPYHLVNWQRGRYQVGGESPAEVKLKHFIATQVAAALTNKAVPAAGVRGSWEHVPIISPILRGSKGCSRRVPGEPAPEGRADGGEAPGGLVSSQPPGGGEDCASPGWMLTPGDFEDMASKGGLDGIERVCGQGAESGETEKGLPESRSREPSGRYETMCEEVWGSMVTVQGMRESSGSTCWQPGGERVRGEVGRRQKDVGERLGSVGEPEAGKTMARDERAERRQLDSAVRAAEGQEECSGSNVKVLREAERVRALRVPESSEIEPKQLHGPTREAEAQQGQRKARRVGDRRT